MTIAADLLVELFVEELPPKTLKRLGESFATLVAEGLRARGLAGAAVGVASFATPRRLAVRVVDVRGRADDQMVSIKLMPVAIALGEDGAPTPALLKKLAALGADASVLPQLERRPDGKAEALFYANPVKGMLLAQGLQQALDDAIAGLPIAKVMEYQLEDGWTSVKFVRPVHGLVALHGADVVPVRALGLAAGRVTHGHRFEATVDPIALRDAGSYEHQLEAEGAVIAGFAMRRADIAAQLLAAASRAGLVTTDDDALLDEVTALVERPNVLLCRFEPEFLAVPPEVLVLTMKANQKYFPLLDAAGKLTNRFLVVSNIRPEDPGRVIEGNERVVRPRLADAKFFYDQDRRKTLASRVPGLDKVVYHGKLGTQGERVVRVRAIARAIGEKLGGTGLAAEADRAALLAKADLLTDMVGEFPELQGTMGRYYALHDGEPEDIAFAIEDHYKPRFAGDELPRSRVGLVVALADKLETLAGLFSIGQAPTGDRDPYALRRHGLGVVRIIIERRLALNVGDALDVAGGAFKVGNVSENSTPAWRPALDRFLGERLNTYLRAELRYTAQEVEAALGVDAYGWSNVVARLEAVRAFASLPEAAALAAANKRVGNILKKVDGTVAAQVDGTLLIEPAEAALHQALAVIKPRADAFFEGGNYTASLQSLASLREPVDAFFDAVMVNADDPALRANRLGLLKMLHDAMNRVADLSRLATRDEAAAFSRSPAQPARALGPALT